MKTISNEEFYQAYLNEEYQRIMSRAMSFYRIDRFEAVRIKDDALWLSLQKFEPGKSKFETFLYNNVKWMCRKQVWQRSPKNTTFVKKMDFLRERDVKKVTESYDPTIEYENKILCDQILDSLEAKERKIMHDRFILSKTLKEIGDEQGVSCQRIDQKIQEIIEKIKLRFDDIF